MKPEVTERKARATDLRTGRDIDPAHPVGGEPAIDGPKTTHPPAGNKPTKDEAGRYIYTSPAPPPQEQ